MPPTNTDSGRAFNAPPTELESRERQLDPFPYYEQHRTADRAFRHNSERNRYEAFSWDTVTAVLENWELFSSNKEIPTDRIGLLDDCIFNIDPPRHTQLRDTIEAFFKPSNIKQFEPRIRTLTNELLDNVDDDDPIALKGDFAYEIPAMVLAEVMGVPKADRDDWRDWCAAFTNIRTGDRTEMQDEQMRKGQAMATYVHDLIEKRREDPQDDLISEIVTADVDGEPMDYTELMGFPALMLFAGNLTTSGWITNAFWTFANEDPSLFDRLRGDESAIADAMEEVLRYQSSVPAVQRTVTRDAEVRGTALSEGDRVLVWLASANRDETQFEAPETFRPDREAAQHVGFGHGIHKCIGNTLGRLQARVAVSTFLNRYDEVTVESTDPDPIWNLFLHGPDELYVTVDG